MPKQALLFWRGIFWASWKPYRPPLQRCRSGCLAGRHFEPFALAFDIPREKRVELVKARGDTEVAKVSGLLAMLDDHLVYEQKFRALHNPDLVITADNLYDHDRVVRAVQERLEQLQKYPL